ncbi:MAG: RelA/SpoT domain-containing protein [Meiothermus sp.]|nr:RelA/SpoT domain-containing protein [Meiothermus sp.]
MNEQEFRQQYERDKPIFQAWGNFIKKTLENKIEEMLRDDERSLYEFVKVPVSPRLKDDTKLVEKAFYRKDKKYHNPYAEITDKVGLRIVVLLLDEIRMICHLVESTDLWVYRKDKDIEEVRYVNPEKFGYESDHYIIYNREPIQFDGVEIPGGVPCELQIRTLLQHAHSELTHDRIYKPKVEASHKVKRIVARSAALIEAADDYFGVVDRSMAEALKTQGAFLNGIKKLFDDAAPSMVRFFNSRLNDFVYSELESLIETNQITLEQIDEFIKENNPLIKRLESRASWNLLAAQPVSLVIYMLLERAPMQTGNKWPLTPDKLETYKADLG